MYIGVEVKNMAGYNEYSKSNNAIEAESEGKFPLTVAIERVAVTAKCTRVQARKALEAIGVCEWHHTSKKYNRTKFYSVAAAIAYIAAQPQMSDLPLDWKTRFERRWNNLTTGADVAERGAARDRAAADIASEFGIDPVILVTAYYGTWGEEG
jgi:hypothetical protein